jgi:hypothetical protein
MLRLDAPRADCAPTARLLDMPDIALRDGGADRAVLLARAALS